MARWIALLCFLIGSHGSLAQQPQIAPEGIVNGASLLPERKFGAGIAPGSIATIFGTDLSASTASATSVPLLRELNGTWVTIDGERVPLFYVSESQINFQVPSYSIFGRFRMEIMVHRGEGASPAMPMFLVPSAPAVFTMNNSGCGRGAVYNVGADGSLSLNTEANSASPGQALAVYLTGFGAYRGAPATGEPAPLDRLLPDLPFPSGPFVGGRMSQSTFAGRVPGFVGLDQINLPIADDAPEGCAIPLSLRSALSSSPEIPVSIKAGGGACEPRPLPRLGEVRLERTIASGLAVPPPEYSLFARFIESRFPRAEWSQPAPSLYNALRLPLVPSSAGACPEFRDRSLDLGILSLEIPAEGVQRVQAPYYGAAQAVPPSNPGSVLTLRSSGGAEVGPLTAAIRMPAPLELETTFAPFTVISSKRDLVIRWRGGEPGSRVRVRLISRNSQGDMYNESGAPVERGFALFGALNGPIPLPTSTKERPARIEVDMESSPEQVTRFSAPGLPEGTFTWRYRWVFDLLQLQ